MTILATSFGVPCGTTASTISGLRVPKILDYGAMAGLKYAQASAANVLAAEDELVRLCGGPS
ncbi:hypothetical protein A5659_03680 [Mycobacterium sp. 1165196.3]|nr:hypothetical protein A5659_03680 [Mycobacterium sp. 1165196.3]OBL07169.1 hypothetical protein A5646_14360 [Mycobacterium sp. 1245499.0]